MGDHDRDHFPRRARPVGRAPEQKPDLAATTPRSKKRPPLVRYVPVQRRARRRRSESPDQRVYDLPRVGWVSIASMTATTVCSGYCVYTYRETSVFFPGELKWLFWVMVASLVLIVINKITEGDEE